MMKKILFIFMSVIMVMAMLLATSVSVAAATPDSATPDDRPLIDEEREWFREFLKNDVTTDDLFSDNEVLVLLYETEDPYDYTLETFAEYGVIDLYRDEYYEYFLILTLDRHDKQNVLDVAYALFDIPGVYLAFPNFEVFPDGWDDWEDWFETDDTTQGADNPATPDMKQPSKTNGNSATAKGGNAVATGDNYYIYFIVFFMIATFIGAIVVRFRNTNFQ